MHKTLLCLLAVLTVTASAFPFQVSSSVLLGRPDCASAPSINDDQEDDDEPFTFASFPTAASLFSSLDISDLSLSQPEAQADPLLTACPVTVNIQFNNWHVENSMDRLDGYITDELFAEAMQRLNTNYADLTFVPIIIRYSALSLICMSTGG